MAASSSGARPPTVPPSSSSRPDVAVTALRGPLISCSGDPFRVGAAAAFTHEPDGLVVCREGLIDAVGPYAALRDRLPPGATVAHWPDCLIAPGFIDTHVHYVQ